MKLSSKSLLSPSRNRDPPQISLQSSLSRRLRSNGSMKGGQASPMFPTGGKRRGCGFENPEPSSPKVTCIGQVRVKTKKQGKKMRARSKRRGEASFRKTDPDLTRQNSQSYQYHNHQNLQQECLKHRNQRWVHLPLTICEALREFNCFFPCRSSCMSSEREKEEKGGAEESSVGHGKEGSCGAAFARWLVALQEGDGKGREIELVMGEDDGGDDDAGRSRRRHVFEDIDIDVVEGKKIEEEFGGEEEKGRVSICIPPKNALLLMRCRSDPVKMAALANKFWESPVQKEYQDDDQNEDNGDDEEEVVEQEEAAEEVEGGEEQNIEMEEDEEVQAKTEEDSSCEREREAGSVNSDDEEDHAIPSPDAAAAEAQPEVHESNEVESRTNPESNEVPEEANQVTEEEEETKEQNPNHEGETFSSTSSPEPHSDLEKPEPPQEAHLQEEENNNPKENENDESSELSPSPATLTASQTQNDDESTNAEAIAETTPQGSREEEGEKGSKSKGVVEERERETLPECLLLMMCEPKLSMEVSKETWVCSTDFIRWLPERPSAAAAAKRVSLDSKPKNNRKPSPAQAQTLMQPPRSSCSSMAAMIEQKLVGPKSNGYEPFVLTRCKSEPMRSTAMAAENCFWKNRKLEPHPPPAAIGAQAGVGF